MYDAVFWLLSVEVIGLATFPLLYITLRDFEDRGFALGKILGILLISYVSWILSVTGVLPSNPVSIISILLIGSLVATIFYWRRREELGRFFRLKFKCLLTTEALFLTVFAAWLILRMFDASIDHTEQPMDLALLNASIVSNLGAPEDPWMRGESVSYYYFGHWMMGVLSQLSGVPAEVAYNLSMALVPALGAVATYTIVSTVISSREKRWLYSFLGGIFAVLVFGLMSNLEGVLEFMRSNAMGSTNFWNWVCIDNIRGPSTATSPTWYPSEFWWWFTATRVINTFDPSCIGTGIDYTINEFPFFSFLLGDLHSHVLAIPLSLLILCFAWQFLLMQLHTWKFFTFDQYLFVLLLGLSLGALAFTNMWSLPVFATLLAGVGFLRSYRNMEVNIGSAFVISLTWLAVLLTLAVILFLPYYWDFSSSIGGIRPSPYSTRYLHTFIVWGPLFALIIPFIASVLWTTILPTNWKQLILASVGITCSPLILWFLIPGDKGNVIHKILHTLPLTILIGMGTFSILASIRTNSSSNRIFVLGLAVVGLFLIQGPELLFLNDVFGTRMNTVFKLYFQAWLLLSVSAGYAFYYWLTIRKSLVGWQRIANTFWTAIAAALLIGALYYAPAAAISKTTSSDTVTLNGLAYLKLQRPEEYEAIHYIRENVEPREGILEAVGEWFEYGLISRSTGRSTVISWPFHEKTWRGENPSLQKRADDVATIYNTKEAQLAIELLRQYDVRYIYIGPRERQSYDPDGLQKFDSIADRVFTHPGGVVLYRLTH